MKVAALAALSVLMALPAEAGQHRRQNGSPATTCDNDGHCTTQRATAPITSYRNRRSKTQRTTATDRFARARRQRQQDSRCHHIAQDRRAGPCWYFLCGTFPSLYR